MTRQVTNQVQGDKCRGCEAELAVKYILQHLLHLFKQKIIPSHYDSVLKNVNIITNYPY